MIFLIGLLFLVHQAQAIDCDSTTSRYQKIQCARVASYNKAVAKAPSDQASKSNAPSFNTPTFTAGATNEEPIAATHEDALTVYTPGQQYQKQKPTKPTKSYFTPF